MGFWQRLFQGATNQRPQAEQVDPRHPTSTASPFELALRQPKKLGAEYSLLPPLPDGWTTQLSLLFLMVSAGFQQPSRNDLIHAVNEVERTTGVSIQDIQHSSSLVLDWAQKAVTNNALGPAFLAHANIVLDLALIHESGVAFLKDLLQALERLRSDVGNVPQVNNTVVAVCSKLWRLTAGSRQ